MRYLFVFLLIGLVGCEQDSDKPICSYIEIEKKCINDLLNGLSQGKVNEKYKEEKKRFSDQLSKANVDQLKICYDNDTALLNLTYRYCQKSKIKGVDKFQTLIIDSNVDSILLFTERKRFTLYHKLYKENKIKIDELMQIYPAEMRNNQALRNTLLREPITVAPSDFTADQLAKFKKSTNPLDKPLRKSDVLKPIEK